VRSEPRDAGVIRTAPIWSSGFRPFFLAAAAYGPALLIAWLGARLGWWGTPVAGLALPLLHAHEMLFGFAAALVCGVLLTALPSWSGAAQLHGPPLAALALLWLAGRVSFLATQVFADPWLAPLLTGAIDCALFPALCVLLLATVRRARLRLFWWTLPPLAAFASANIAFHIALASGSYAGAQRALLLGVHALAFLFTLYGGLFIPAFTRRWLHARGEHAATILMPLEYATAITMVAFACADLLDASRAWMTATAGAAAIVQTWRCARWRGWRTASEPLLWSIHLGYGWLVVALVLRALSAILPDVPREAWIHAFTVGAYGMLKIGLMTRVVLRHTGRPVHAGRLMSFAFVMVFAAALLRLAYAMHEFGEWALVGSALLWAAALLVYLVRFGRFLYLPSLQRS
jgi:uncharacterized protein involved in response to NO